MIVCRSLLGVDVAPEVLGLLRVVAWNHSWLAWLPSSGANFAVFISKGESLDKTKHLVRASADGEVVDTVLTQNSFLIDNVGGTEGCESFAAFVLNEAAIIASEASVDVSNKWDVHVSETALVLRSHSPSLVYKDRITRAPDDLAISICELFSLVIKLAHFSRADESKVEGIEEENDVLA